MLQPGRASRTQSRASPKHFCYVPGAKMWREGQRRGALGLSLNLPAASVSTGGPPFPCHPDPCGRLLPHLPSHPRANPVDPMVWVWICGSHPRRPAGATVPMMTALEVSWLPFPLCHRPLPALPPGRVLDVNQTCVLLEAPQ